MSASCSQRVGLGGTMEVVEKRRLQARIEELEQELADREQDLRKYRQELILTNERLHGLIANISHDIKVLTSIQKLLVPTEFPNIPGFEFSSKFIASPIQGGDYFDIFEHHDRFRFGLVLTSSSGYSMSALLLSVLLKLTGHSEMRRGRLAAEMVEVLREELFRSLAEEDRAHIFYGVIDRRNLELRYAHLGQMVAIHFQYGRQEFIRLGSLGPALGLQNREPVVEEVVTLNARDRLILVSEGLFHVRDMNDQELGEERFYESLRQVQDKSVHEIRNEILYQIEKFRNGRQLSRDLTVIVVEVKDRVIRLAQD